MWQPGIVSMSMWETANGASSQKWLRFFHFWNVDVILFLNHAISSFLLITLLTLFRVHTGHSVNKTTIGSDNIALFPLEANFGQIQNAMIFIHNYELTYIVYKNVGHSVLLSRNWYPQHWPDPEPCFRPDSGDDLPWSSHGCHWYLGGYWGPELRCHGEHPPGGHWG